jgi:TRAP-type mannitol/chloroaromatic compound transport system substrate-binding protein
MGIDRRRFLKSGMAMGAATFLGKPLTDNATILRLGAVGLMLNKPLRKEINHFIERVALQTKGQLQIGFNETSLALSPSDLISALQADRLEMGLHSPAFLQKKIPAAAFFGGLPHGISSEKKILWLTSEQGASLWDRLYASEGLKPLFFGCGASSYGQVFRKQVQGLDDLKDMTVCSSDLRSRWFEAVGLKPQAYSSMETMALALKYGSLDISEPLQHAANHQLGIHRLGYHYYINSWQRTSATVELLIPQRTWLALGAGGQDIVKEAAMSSGLSLYQRITGRENEFLEKIARETGAVHHYPEAVVRAFEAPAMSLSERIAALNPLSREIRDTYLWFKNRMV